MGYFIVKHPRVAPLQRTHPPNCIFAHEELLDGTFASLCPPSTSSRSLTGRLLMPRGMIVKGHDSRVPFGLYRRSFLAFLTYPWLKKTQWDCVVTMATHRQFKPPILQARRQRHSLSLQLVALAEYMWYGCDKRWPLPLNPHPCAIVMSRTILPTRRPSYFHRMEVLLLSTSSTMPVGCLSNIIFIILQRGWRVDGWNVRTARCRYYRNIPIPGP